METNVKISVIIPAFNAENEISRCLESVLNQSIEDLEIIVVDDGSTDKTLEIANNYADKSGGKVIVIHKKNEGVTAARLYGVEKARGKWIGFVDADDEIEADMYELLLSNAEQYHADISHCGYQMVFPDAKVSFFHNTEVTVVQDKLQGLKDLLDGVLIEPGLWNKMFRKELFWNLLHSDVMDKDIKINEDLLMNYILFSESRKSVFEDKCKYHYIVRSTSATRTPLNEHRIYDPIRVKQAIIDMNIENMEECCSGAYLGTCINVYNSLMLDTTNQFINDEDEVYDLIKTHKSWRHFLKNKQKITVLLIIYLQFAYKKIYRIYAKHFMKNAYE